MREYRDDIVYRNVEHKFGKSEFVDLMVSVRYLIRNGSNKTQLLMKHTIEQLSTVQNDLTDWLGICVNLLRVINAAIGTDNSIFKEDIMDTRQFTAAIDSFSADCNAIRERITSEIGKGSQAFAHPAVNEIQAKMDGLYDKYTKFLLLGFLA